MLCDIYENTCGESHLGLNEHIFIFTDLFHLSDFSY
jgi:hypothetical protein